MAKTNDYEKWLKDNGKEPSREAMMEYLSQKYPVEGRSK